MTACLNRKWSKSSLLLVLLGTAVCEEAVETTFSRSTMTNISAFSISVYLTNICFSVFRNVSTKDATGGLNSKPPHLSVVLEPALINLWDMDPTYY